MNTDSKLSTSPYPCLHAGRAREGGDLDGGASREIAGEILAVDLVHAGEVREVREEDGALHDVGKGQPLIVEDALHVFQHAAGLVLDVAGDELAGGRIDGNLPGAEQEVANADGVVVGTNGRRALGGFDDGFSHAAGELNRGGRKCQKDFGRTDYFFSALATASSSASPRRFLAMILPSPSSR